MKPAPSAWRIEQAMAALQGARQRLLAEDVTIADDDTLLHDLLEGETGDAMEVLHRVIRAAIECDDRADDARRRADRLAERRKRYEARRDALRGMAFAAMDALELRRIEAADFTASVAQPRPAVVVTDPDALPDDCIRVTRAPDKTAIGDALRAGREVPGAALSNGLPSLQLRTR